MADIEQIIDVQISRQTTAVTQAGFGIGMFLGLHKRFNERAVSYANTAAMTTAGFEATDKEFIAASVYFGQNPAPVSIVIGRQTTSDVQVITFEAAAAAGVVFTITIDDNSGGPEIFTYTSSGVETSAQTAAGMELLVNASGTLAITMDDSAADGTATLTPDVALTPYTLKLTSNITVSLATTETLTDALTAVSQVADYYGVMCYSHLEADILEVATFAAGNKKLHGYSTADAVAKTTAITGIMGQLKDLSRERSFGMWDEEAGIAQGDATEYPEAAWMGDRFPHAPGSATWMFKTLDGISVDSLADTESTNIRNKNGNTYELIAGVNITREGKVASGEFIDVIRGVDWLESRMEERIFSRFVNLPKIPFTNAGIAIIEAEVRAQLQEAVEAGVLDGEQPITVTSPKISSISANDRANRILPAITFEAKLAGAIHNATVKGTVTV